jgi:hypothetical protein
MLYANMFVWVAIENYLYCIDPIRYSMVSTVVMPSGINCMIGVKLVTGKKLWVALQDSTIKVFDIEGLKDYRRKYSIASASTPIIEVHDESKRISTRLALMDKHAEESSPSLEHKSNNTNHNNGSSDNDLTPVRKTSRKHREVESKQLRRHQRADFPCIKTMGPIPLMGVQDFVNIQSNWIWSAGDDGVIRIWNASVCLLFLLCKIEPNVRVSDVRNVRRVGEEARWTDHDDDSLGHDSVVCEQGRNDLHLDLKNTCIIIAILCLRS